MRSPADVHKEADLGKHNFTYAYYPHNNSLANSNVIQHAHSLNQKLYLLESDIIPNNQEISLFKTDNQAIVIQTIKYAEASNDIILRCYESLGSMQKCNLELTDDYSSAYLCNMLEENEELLAIKDKSLELVFNPFEIKTIKLTLKED